MPTSHRPAGARRPRHLGVAVIGAIAVTVLLAGCATGTSSTGASSSSLTTADASAAASPSASASAFADPSLGRPVPVVVSDPRPVLPVTIVDADGNETTVTDLSRIVALQGGITETLFAYGLGDKVVGRDISTQFPGAEDITLVSNAHDISAEGVLSLRPTLVLADDRNGPPEAMEAIRAAGVPVVVVPEVWTLEEASARNDAIAAAVGLPDAGPVLTGYLDDHASDSRVSDAPVVAFLYLRGNAAVYLMGGDGSGADSLIEAIGGVDAGSKLGLGPFTPLTPEAMVESAPDAILLMTKGLDSVGGIDGLVAMPGIAQTPAAQNRRIITVPDGQLLNFGPRTADTLADIAAQLTATGTT